MGLSLVVGGALPRARRGVMVHHYMSQDHEGGLPSAAVSRIAEIPLPTLVQLASTGVITPSLRATSGRGTARRWSFSDTCALRLLARAREFGIPPSKLKPLVEYIQRMKLTPQSEPEIVLVQRQDGQVVKRSPRGDVRFFGKGLTAYVVDVDALVTETGAEQFELLLRRPAMGRPTTKSSDRPKTAPRRKPLRERRS